MIIVKWKDHELKDDSAEFGSMRKAQKFITEYICTQPIILNSIRVVDDGTEYYFKYKFDESQLSKKKQILLLWQDHEGKDNSAPFKTMEQAYEFVYKILLSKPVIWNSIRIIESIIDYRVNGELSPITKEICEEK
ncbi:hypothetical protein [Sporomusa aerivorans]|uniref:hypothetical protein n=1 Tax=Sporomusa aerivorans TaxID=204936 RepID=UPI00352BAE7E